MDKNRRESAYKTAEFTAVTFDELFEKTKAVDWSKWIGKNDAFPVKGYSLKSTLASVRDCQAIIKKATAESLSNKYGIEWLPEDGANYQIQFSIFKDKVTLMIDTSGEGTSQTRLQTTFKCCTAKKKHLPPQWLN